MSKKLVLFLIGYILSFIILVVLINYSYKKDNIDRVIYNYDSMHNGDYIPFNTTIKGEINLFGVYSYRKNNYYYFTRKGHIQSIIKACYCKDNTCINTKKCDKNIPMLQLGKEDTFSYDVENYNNLFGRNNNYTGWKIYYIPIEYTKIYETYNESFIGTYYDIYFIPTSGNNDITNTKYYKSIKYTDKLDSNWIKDNNIAISNKGKNGIYTISFSAKKGDILTFEIKTSDDNLEILLNDKNINKEIKLNNDIRNNINNSKYQTKIYELEEDGDYKLKFVDKYIEDTDEKLYVNYYKYTYIKNLNILRESNEEIDKVIIERNDEYIVGDYNE